LRQKWDGFVDACEFGIDTDYAAKTAAIDSKDRRVLSTIVPASTRVPSLPDPSRQRQSARDT
jgi:hypothetical protein